MAHAYLLGMKDILRSNDPTEIALAKAALDAEGIDWFEWDVNMSVLEGSIGIFPRRLAVADVFYDQAIAVLVDHGLA